MASTILSDNGVSSGSAGLKTTADSTGALALQTSTSGGAATTALTIDTSQNVGIGTSSPTTQLEIKSAAFTDSQITLDNTSSNTTSRVLFKAAGTEYGRVAGDATQVALQANNIPMVFRVNSAERMRIDTSGNVGIGQTPTYKLDVLGSTTRIYNDSATLLLQRPSNSRSGQILINNANGGIKYYAGSNGSGENSVVAHEFTSDAPSTGTVLARINSYGIGLGANTPSSGTGITFPATQSASSDANTLDDYEEGTWTPQAGSDLGAFTQTGTFTGKYVKIGSRVWATFDCSLSSRTTTGSVAQLWGLPFAVANNGDLSGGTGSVGITFNIGSNFYQIGIYPQNASSYCFITGSTSNTTGLSTMAVGFWGATTRLVGGVMYNTTS